MAKVIRPFRLDCSRCLATLLLSHHHHQPEIKDVDNQPTDRPTERPSRRQRKIWTSKQDKSCSQIKTRLPCARCTYDKCSRRRRQEHETTIVCHFIRPYIRRRRRIERTQSSLSCWQESRSVSSTRARPTAVGVEVVQVTAVEKLIGCL